MKQLWINGKLLNNDEGKPVEAERIEFGQDVITGHTGHSEVFTLRGLNPETIYAVCDKTGKVLEPDLSDIAELKKRVEDLEKQSDTAP